MCIFPSKLFLIHPLIDVVAIDFSYGFKLGTWLSPTVETGYIHEIFPVDIEGNNDFAKLLKVRYCQTHSAKVSAG